MTRVQFERYLGLVSNHALFNDRGQTFLHVSESDEIIEAFRYAGQGHLLIGRLFWDKDDVRFERSEGAEHGVEALLSFEEFIGTSFLDPSILLHN